MNYHQLCLYQLSFIITYQLNVVYTGYTIYTLSIDTNICIVYPQSVHTVLATEYFLECGITLLVAFGQTGYNVASIGTRITDPLSSFQFLTAAIVQLSQRAAEV